MLAKALFRPLASGLRREAFASALVGALAGREGQGGDGCGELIHAEAVGARERCAVRKTEGDDQQAPFGAEGEIMGGRFVALGESFVGDEDNFGAEVFGFFPDRFLCRRNEWGDNHSSIGAGVKPALAIGLPGPGIICAMNYHLLLEWIHEEVDVAVGGIINSPDIELIDAAEVFRICYSDGKPIGILAEIDIEAIQIPSGG